MTDEWLIRRKGNRKAAAHIWHRTDTACRMFSTGGLGRNPRKRYMVMMVRGNHRICAMCQTNEAKAMHALAPKPELPIDPWDEDIALVDLDALG